MRKQLGLVPANTTDEVTKGYVDTGTIVFQNKALGAGTTLLQNLASVSASSYAIPVNGGPYQGMSISANVTTPTLASGVTGQLLVIEVIQDATGGRAFAWSNLSNVSWLQNGVPPITDTVAFGRTAVVLIYDSAAWIELARQDALAYAPTSLYTAKGMLLAASAASTPAGVAVGADDTVLMADSTQAAGVRWGSIPHDVYYLQCLGTRVAATLGDNTLGIKLQRAVTFVSVTFRCGVADGSGSGVFELRKNGSSVSGTATTVAAANQVAGGTTTGSWSFAAGDILTVYTTSVGGTPGTGLVADITGVVV